ncbi:hypothetical protein [Streptomyces griseoflavus]|uniref:hypothetical protein n=1 Tax=Streptomyces griseoflavus TaxID=35619 RepID=UPI0001B4B662|nr:hypothetical protein [Streptomyces griseoflavus]
MPARPQRLRAFAGLPEEERVAAPSIQVNKISAVHVAREVTRLYPQHAQAMERAAERTATSRPRHAPAAPSPRP